jgi:hypothetical protein
MCNEQLEFKFYDIYPEQIELPLDYPQLNWSVVNDNGFGNFTIKYEQPTVTFSLGYDYAPDK